MKTSLLFCKAPQLGTGIDEKTDAVDAYTSTFDAEAKARAGITEIRTSTRPSSEPEAGLWITSAWVTVFFVLELPLHPCHHGYNTILVVENPGIFPPHRPVSRP